MNFDPEIKCNLCDNHGYYKLFAKEYKGDLFQLVECSNCGLKYINPQPSDEDLKYFYDFILYSEGWLSQFHASTHPFYFEKRTQEGLAGYRTYLDYVEQFIEGGRMLDVGCGDGPFFQMADRKRWEFYGLDSSLKAYEHFKNNPLVRFYHGTIETAPYPDAFFDIVFSIDSIEHVKNPMMYLKTIYRVLKPSGILCLNTVNIKNPVARKKREKWVQFTPPGHLYYFSPKAIKMYLKKAGFKVLKFDMRVPLFAPLNYGTLVSVNSSGKSAMDSPPKTAGGSILFLLKPFKPVLVPVYDTLCQLKGRIVGKHDITVYARKV